MQGIDASKSVDEIQKEIDKKQQEKKRLPVWSQSELNIHVDATSIQKVN